ncbi:hypothetical protein D9613_005628 [Agrocybe pediades]|uniref:Uncharacterized protein n=1 Tax=Agrocybe pediades TaxID=84607 RepID=A0A8H4QUQ8_9AGAR|nr:hypothetical protein D9613_005628 [Agrocybe pediades]
MFEFLERQITHFLIPAYRLLQARLAANAIINAQAFIAPLSILFEGYGVSTTALVCAVVEIIALVILIFTHGLEGTIMDLTLPYLFSRLKIVFLFIYVTFASHASPLASKSTIYIRSAFITRPALESQPGHSLLHIPRYIFTFLFGEDYLHSTILYFKSLHYRVGNYAIRQMEKKLFYPCRRTLEKMKEDPTLAFTLRVVLPLFAIMFLWTSIVVAFFVVCALDLATKISATGNKHRGLSIEGVWECDDSESSTFTLAEDDDSLATLTIMDAGEKDADTTIFSINDSRGKEVIELEDEPLVVEEVTDEEVEEEVFEDAIEDVEEEVIEEVLDVVGKEDIGFDAGKGSVILEAVDEVAEVEVNEDFVEVDAVEAEAEVDEEAGKEQSVEKEVFVQMEENALMEEEEAIACAMVDVEESGPAMGGEVGYELEEGAMGLAGGGVNGTEPVSTVAPIEKKVEPGKALSAGLGQISRLTPFAAPFVPRFTRTPVPILASAAPIPPAPSIFHQLPPSQTIPAHWPHAPPPPPIPASQSTPAHWGPARTVPVVLEAPRRRGGRGCKGIENTEGAAASKGPSRKERHIKLMGLATKNRP